MNSVYLYVHLISDLSVQYNWSGGVEVGINQLTSIGSLKQHVAQVTGVPVERHCYHAASDSRDGRVRFDTAGIFLGGADDDDNRTVLSMLNYINMQMCVRTTTIQRIGVVFLPEQEEEDSGVKVVREVDTAEAVRDRISAGAADAVVIGDSDGGGAETQPAKRARHVVKAESCSAGRSTRHNAAGRDGVENREEGQPTESRREVRSVEYPAAFYRVAPQIMADMSSKLERKLARLMLKAVESEPWLGNMVRYMDPATDPREAFKTVYQHWQEDNEQEEESGIICGGGTSSSTVAATVVSSTTTTTSI